ncbi:HotDog domain-containing protein [Fimicolochytrium jonesii]|uniref:HotDog domain-containing protein n=1 Tax=Fimicolochytrium jonesii TaxID=1396493 RepID=UPI0022FF1AE4|nr:HotDog domain-containing protein [Fimicolochytrium jonesii]KAI8822968.1 HotDog domain-containing protein [Fimicolochytrium jonesii]
MRPTRTALETVTRTWHSLANFGGLDTRVLGGMRVITASQETGSVKCEMEVEKHHLNRLQGLHGGAICTLVDIVGSLAIAAKTNNSHTGVSSDISVSFMNGGKLGNKLEISSTCHKAGRNLAYATVQIHSGNKLLATGSHTKFIGNPPTKDFLDESK